jgi:hypothetical protein
LENYLGECNCCLSCEKKDDLGLHGNFDFNDSKFAENGVDREESETELMPDANIGLGLFVSSLPLGGIKNAV